MSEDKKPAMKTGVYLCSALLVSSLLLPLLAQAERVSDRDQQWRSQYARAGQLLMQQPTVGRGSGSYTALSGQVVVGNRTALPPGLIDLPSNGDSNRQLVLSMNAARINLTALQNRRGTTNQEQRRAAVMDGLERAAMAYLTCRTAAGVPPIADPEHDPFLREIVAVQRGLYRETLDANTVRDLLDRLATARSMLVSLTQQTRRNRT